VRIVVDDALLFAIISEQTGEVFAPYVEASTRNEVFTTSSWYWRLSRAISTAAMARYRGRSSNWPTWNVGGC
jgi:hypothetical protein